MLALTKTISVLQELKTDKRNKKTKFNVERWSTKGALVARQWAGGCKWKDQCNLDGIFKKMRHKKQKCTRGIL